MKTEQRIDQGINTRFTKKQINKVRLLAYKWKCSIQKIDQRINTRFTKKQIAKVRLLAYKWKCSMAEVLRKLVDKATP